MERREFLAGLGLAAGAAVFGLPRLALADPWALLGTRQVSWLAEEDVISGFGQGLFDHIQFRVRGNDIFIGDVKVMYGNGAIDDIPVRAHIPQGGASRVIDLRGGDRFITGVRFVYRRAIDGGGPAWVELWGQR